MKPQGSGDYLYCGQDKAYLAELLLAKGYIVDIEHFYQAPHELARHRFLHYGDMSDATNLICIAQGTGPDEIYNLAEQSHVQESFETAEYTASADGLGTLRLPEVIRVFAEVAIDLVWEGSGPEQRGRDQRSGRVVVEIDPRYFRPVSAGNPRSASVRASPSPTTGTAGRVMRCVDLNGLVDSSGPVSNASSGIGRRHLDSTRLRSTVRLIFPMDSVHQSIMRSNQNLESYAFLPNIGGLEVARRGFGRRGLNRVLRRRDFQKLFPPGVMAIIPSWAGDRTADCRLLRCEADTDCGGPFRTRGVGGVVWHLEAAGASKKAVRSILELSRSFVVDPSRVVGRRTTFCRCPFYVACR